MALSSSNTLLGLLLKGGWLMIPLALLSIISLYIIIERILTYRKYLDISKTFLENLETQINQGNIDQIYHCCTNHNNIIEQVIRHSIKHKETHRKSATLILKSESKKALSILEENLSFLASIAEIAPIIGFLGTVTGMIQTFMAVGNENGQGITQVFSHGIYEAMITTVTGLIISIIAYVAYNYFMSRVNKTIDHLEYLINLFLIKVIPKN